MAFFEWLQTNKLPTVSCLVFFFLSSMESFVLWGLKMAIERSLGTKTYLVYRNLLCYKCKWSLPCALGWVLPRLHSPWHLIPKDTWVKQSRGLASGLWKDTAPADFSTQQVWMVVSGRAYSSLCCKLISSIFTRSGAFSFFLLPRCLE